MRVLVEINQANPPMSIRYTKIVKHPTIFLRLFGVNPIQFNEISTKVAPLWERQILGKYKRPGRAFVLSLEDMILMLLLYYRSYATQMFVGFLFGIDDSRVCRIIQKLEPLLAKVMAIPKEKYLSKEEVEAIVVDATEQPIERPKKRQKPYYSGKKKRHTVKTEIRASLKGRINHVSKTVPGAVHDFTLHKKEPPLHPKSRAFADSGYQGLNKIHSETELPYKATKTKPLDREEKEYNGALSRVRIIIENILGDIAKPL
jgi:hypothetical protein